MPALYRTYRPKRFSEVVGQEHIVRTLKNAVVAGRPAHAYLFCGGRGLGKTTLARVLARALNCENPDQAGEACLNCRVCREIESNSFLDLVEIDAASHTGVDNVRSLIESVNFHPVSGKYKVYIFDEVHMLSKGAWNALLKTLEEPPAQTVFVLATTESSKVPATVHSRAQRFDFLQFSKPELQGQMEAVLAKEGKSLDPEVLALVAGLAGGGMRDALTLLDQILSVGEEINLAQAEVLLGATSEQWIFELLDLVRSGNISGLSEYFTRLEERYFDMQAVCRDVLEELRHRMHASAGKVSYKDDLSFTDLAFLIRQYLRAYKEIPISPDPVLPLLLASMEAAVKFMPPAGAQVYSHAAVSPPASKLQEKVLETETVEMTAAETDVGHATMEQVAASWSEVCGQLKEVNRPLATLARNAPILSVQGGVLTLGVKYLFHKEQLEAAKSRRQLAESLRQVFGGSWQVSASFVEVADAPAEGVDLSGALRIFGGELVDV